MTANRRKLVYFILGMLSLAAVLFSCAKPAPEQYTATEPSQIIYKTVGVTEVGLDILYPTKRLYDQNPTVLVLHGGGWVSGTGEDFSRDFAPLCELLRANGITVVTIDYRLALDGLTWRDCLADTEDALAYLVDHAEVYDIDTERLGIIGYSAGAQLAMLTAIETGDQLRYCVSMSGPTTFTMQNDSAYYSPTLAYYVDLAFDDDLQLDIYKASPVIRISRKCRTDFLMIAGSADDVVPVSHAELFVREAESFGISADLLIVDGLTHIYPIFSGYQELCDSIGEKVIEALS